MGHAARNVHLVGSIPLAGAAEVFRTVGSILGERVRRIPDGETGRRRNWINFQYALFARHPQLELVGPPSDPEGFVLESGGKGADYVLPTPLRPRPHARPEDLCFDGLGYAQNAIASYALFRDLREQGVVPRSCRLQVSLPTPLAPVALFIAPDSAAAVMPAYARALLGELQQIAAAIPAHDLAVQWDVAVEFGLWEGLLPPPPGDWNAMLLDQLAQLGDAVPAGVDLGYHLCYGDRGHKHFVEPRDTSKLTAVANGLSARVSRTIEWIHLPVPRDRADDAYFSPLAGLERKPGTALVLGLVHHTDGVSGTRRRIEAASRTVADYAIATVCGLGRRDPATIPDLLRIHREVAGER
jgi:hypothetical protein